MRRSKQARQQAIRTLVLTERIQKQEDLVKHLNAQGWEVTQATVSRDIAELQLVKVPDQNGGFIYAVMTDTDYLNQLGLILRETTTKVITQQNMVMIKVTPGTGPALKMALEEANLGDVFGLIGDDAGVLVILKENIDAEEFTKMLMMHH
ncbi:arginine catabolic regulator [Weissella oryzae SG25]|uniref:Arginine repressor n=1 Tax=Weissella oryzae (strain DSM 25784 / JCM 18191 / LMG 30913 / SG25) TaxID=1329250 RepID=A0A069D220_WEIOS|nr:arginine catabolic regulator [Weissella oryzae]GAK31426.1 arginine catabolic regulator [Weissella oryzae SG25]